MVLLALAIPFMGVAVAAHGGAGTADVDIDQITLTPESASLPPGGACVQFTAHATDGGAVAEGETIDIVASLQDDDNPAATTGESADVTLAFCDPDATGPGTDAGGDSDTDDDGGNESAASIHGECLTDLNGDCVFGLSAVDTGAGPGAASGSVTAFADLNNNDTLDPAEARDTATLTVGSGAVSNISCTPATQSQPEGGRAEFLCTATNAAGQPLAGVTITGDVNAGPNTEEVPPFLCAPTNAQGQTPNTNGVPTGGTCGYNDSTATTSPPGTDTVNFCTQAAAQPGQPSTAGCDPHELSAQGNATASVTWVGPASGISCVPDGQNATPGTTQLVTCQVSDINNQPSPAGIDCNFTETGPGTVTEQNGGLTNAQGQCSATATTFGNEVGLQTITGNLAGGAGTNCQSGAGEGTPTTTAPAGTDCSDTASINWGGTTTEPPPPGDCADGSDNDGDGEIDLNDRGCRTAEDPTEAGPFASAITLRLRRARPRGFTGQVASTFARCQAGRAVTILRRGRGVIGSDTTNRDGNYFVRFRGRRGRFQAKVARKVITTRSGDEIICQPDRSPVIGVRRRR
jgi:hypothetical protein